MLTRERVKIDPARVRLMRSRKWSWQAIGEYFGVADGTVRALVDPVFKAKMDELRRKSDERKSHNATPKEIIQRPKCPSHVLLEREQRMAIIPTINQAILGDPLPGQSALDRKRHLGAHNG